MHPPCYLFLDFDGVLHPKAANASQYFVDLPRLERVLRAFPQVAVVIASSWRHTQPLAALRTHFSEDIQARIVGVTPDVPPKPGADDRGSRQVEIATWLLQHGQVTWPWVALDDESRLYLPGAPVVVTTDGFGRDDAERLRVALCDPWQYALRCATLATSCWP